MRILFALLVLSCGDGKTDPLVPSDGGSSKPECRPCADGLTRDTAPCPAMSDACINDPMMTLEEQVACFQTDARCYITALDRSSSCHRQCGDEEQANVESCTGECFADRGNCYEQAIRRADACLDTGDVALCRAFFENDAAGCDQAAVSCADTCKRVHRDG